jgi:hypothetical protein
VPRARRRAVGERAGEAATGGDHGVEQAGVAERIDDIDAAAEDGHGGAARVERAAVGGAVDAEGAAGDHQAAGGRDLAAEAKGRVEGIALGRPRPDDGHSQRAIRN